MLNFKIQNTSPEDLPFIYQLFDQSILYQESKGYPVWKNYDKNALFRDVENKNQYKIVIDSQIAMVFSVCYADKVIWREREQGDAVYLHRIVVNPNFKGQRLFEKILNWSIDHAKERKLCFVRMDTWASNPTIINYYVGFGFAYLGNFTTPDTDELPVHNRKLQLALLEMKVL